jgi:signal transduction histidine kinase
MGVITLLCDQPERFTGASLPLLTTIADQIGAAVENIDLRRLSRQAAIIEERERLAHDLHDAVTQTIYSASLFAEAARESIQAQNLPKARRHVLSVLRMTDQALRELRLLLFELRTEMLARKGLASALQERFQMVEHRAGIKAGVQSSGVKDHLPANLEDAFYRVALEALNNSLRHARATQVEIVLAMEGGDLVMVIVDDGVGFDQSTTNGGGMGLEGMKKRLARVGGVMTLTSSPGGGTHIVVRAPDLGDSTSGGNHVNG